MFASNDRLASGRVLLPWCLGVALALGCATTQPEAAAPTAVLSEVSVESGDAGTVVSLMGASDATYESFLQDDPARIVVDLRSVSPGYVAESLAVYDGLLEEVTITGFEDAAGEPQTRIELGLAAEAGYEIEVQDDRLAIRLAPISEPAAMADGEDPWADVAPLAEAEAVVPSQPATALTSVGAEAQGDGTVLQLGADGTIGAFEHFVLENPDRLVVDLPGLTSQAGAWTDMADGPISRIRVGQHEDKVRVVVDAESADAIAAPEIVATPTGLQIAVGGAVLAAAAPPAAPADEATVTESGDATTEVADEASPADEIADEAASDEGEGARVASVSFAADADRDRITIGTHGTVAPQLLMPDAETLVVAFPGATLAPEGEVRIVPEPARSVSLLSSFQQPDVDVPEVRLVVRRAAGVEPELVIEGSVVHIDFPASEVAAAAPAGQAETAVAAEEDAASEDHSLIIAKEIKPTMEAPPAALGEVEAIQILREGGLLDGKQYVGRRISLDFKDVDISDVLRLIAEVSDLNIIAGDEVKGEVTIRLVDVPWDQALDVILLTKGLGFVRVGNVLRIAPSDVLKAEDESRLQERRAKEKLEDLLVKLQPVNYADVKEVSKMVNRLLTARGTVDVDQRTNTLIIKDISGVIDEATALVKAIDTQTPQVLIESKIVEAALDFSRELGSTWAFGAQPLNDGFDESSGDRRDLGGNDFRLHDNPLLSTFTETFNHVSVSNPITSVANGLLDVGAFLLDDKLNLELRIEAAESNGEGKVISSPRVVTLDNRTATIEQGVSIPFQTFENGDAKLEFIDAVLKLEVTPHITADRSIIMKIEVQRNAPDDSVQTPTGSPAIAKNEAFTETLVKDGQTLVIGGIYTVQKAERSSQVPYFGDIPILGVMFRNNEIRDQRKELLIFVTPRIVQNTQVAS